MAEEIPKLLGRYEIQEEIGRGMMGVVYRALDPALGRTVALKTVRLAFVISDTDRDTFEKRFLAEARVAAGLSHPGIVIVHDVGRDDKTGVVYIALEFLHGTPLASLVGDGRPLEWKEALRLTARLAEALAHAHGHGVVHRDIKPANIMVLPSGEPKIMDFGIAKIPTSQLTTAGEFFGTPSYMSPEQARGEAVDGRSDLFSLGSVLYYLVTGQRAFDAPSVPAILSRVSSKDPPAPSSIVATLPRDVDDVVRRALAKDPAARYPDGRTFAQDLDDVLAGRPPRHRAGWTPPREDGTMFSLEPLEEDDAPPAAAKPQRTATLNRRAAPAAAAETGVLIRVSDRIGTKGLLVGGAVLAAVVLGAVVLRRAPAARDVTPPATMTASESEPGPSPSPASLLGGLFARKDPAHLELTFEHSFQGGTLKVWVDDDVVLTEPLKSAVTKKIGPMRKRKGRVSKVFEVSPGEHVIKVEVQGDDFAGGSRIKGTFESGATRRLEINKEGLPLLHKELSLDLS